MATSRTTIRQDVGTALGDMFIATATSAGTTTTFLDVNTLVLPANEYKGRTIWFSDGTVANLEQSRKINGSTPGTGTVQWAVALPSATAAGDEAEMWNLRGTGWEPQEINRLIKMAHREAQEHIPIPLTSSEFTWDEDAPTLTIPEAMIAVTGVEYQHQVSEAWNAIPRAQRRGAPGYYVQREDRTIRIDGPLRYGLDGFTLRIHGEQRESPMVDDSDLTQINVEYLVARVCEMACSALLLRTPDPGLVRDKMLTFQGEARAKRTMAIPRRAVNRDRVD
jgi:hypothetical protein